MVAAAGARSQQRASGPVRTTACDIPVPVGPRSCWRPRTRLSWKLAALNLSLPGFADLALQGSDGRPATRSQPPRAGGARASIVVADGRFVAARRHSFALRRHTVATDVARVSVASRRTFMVTDPRPIGVNYDPAWRNQASDRSMGRPKRIAAVTVIRPMGEGRSQSVNDDRLICQRCPGRCSPARDLYLAARDPRRHRAGHLSRLRLRDRSHHLGQKQLRDRPRPLHSSTSRAVTWCARYNASWVGTFSTTWEGARLIGRSRCRGHRSTRPPGGRITHVKRFLYQD